MPTFGADWASMSPDVALFVSVPEAARLLGIGKTKAFDMVHQGELSAVRIGRRRLVPRAALLAMVEAAMTSTIGSAGAYDPGCYGRRRPAAAAVFATIRSVRKAPRAQGQSQAYTPARRAVGGLCRTAPIWRPTPPTSDLWLLAERSARAGGESQGDARLREATA